MEDFRRHVYVHVVYVLVEIMGELNGHLPNGTAEYVRFLRFEGGTGPNINLIVTLCKPLRFGRFEEFFTIIPTPQEGNRAQFPPKI